LQNLVNIGKIVGTHHLKGSIKVNSVLEDISVLEGKKVIFQSKLGDKNLFTVSNVKPLSINRFVIDLEEINNINKAKSYIGNEIYVKRDILGKLNENEYLLIDLIGLTVISEEGQIIGKILDVMLTGAHDIYVIEHDGKEIMIPAVDEFVKNIDFEKREIVVKIIEGMI